MRDLFEVDWRDPALYDVVVNLAEMSLETAADVVVYLAEHPEYQPTAASRKALDDLTLRCRVQAAIAAHPATIGIMVEAKADGGSVRLAGVVEFDELEEDIIHIAQTVPGVQEVISDLEVKPTLPYVEL
jgi:osmotically-inducible protein OsmY